MVLTIRVLFLMLAVLLSLCAALGINPPRVSLLALSVTFFAASFLIG